MTVPSGAVVYSLGLRVSDTRKNKDAGSATSGLVDGQNGDTIALSDADNSAGVISYHCCFNPDHLQSLVAPSPPPLQRTVL